MQFGIQVIPLEVVKPGSKFKFPDQDFFDLLVKGKILDNEGMKVLAMCGLTLEDVEKALKMVFQKIALPYSPHRSAGIRRIEVQALLQRCTLAEGLSKQGHPRTTTESIVHKETTGESLPGVPQDDAADVEYRQEDKPLEEPLAATDHQTPPDF